MADVVKKLLDAFISGQSLSDLFKTGKEEKDVLENSTRQDIQIKYIPTTGPKRDRSPDILEDKVTCDKCQFTTNDSSVLKRHKRDVHISTSQSISPPRKKPGQLQGVTQCAQEVEDIIVEELDISSQVDIDLKLFETTSFEENRYLVSEEMDNDEAKLNIQEKAVSNSIPTNINVEIIQNAVTQDKAGTNSTKDIVESRNIKNKDDNPIEKVDVQKELSENYCICKAKSDGRCGAHCISMHIYNDETKEKQVMTELNSHIINHWNSNKESFSFPFNHPIGIGRDNMQFNDESSLKDFIQNNPDAVNLWVDHQWLQAAASLYNTKIHILTTGVQVPRWTTLDPNPKEQNSDNMKKSTNMYLLHSDNVHFDLLIPKKTKENYVSSYKDKDQESLPENKEIETKELVSLRFELAESKKEVAALKGLVKQLLPDASFEKTVFKPTEDNEKVIVENNICPECGKHFAKFINLEAHMRQDHNNTKTLSCTICRKQYSTKENLGNHINAEHKKKFDCDSCEKSFSSEEELQSHDKNDHTSQFNCEQCDYQATTKDLLDNHLENKHSQKYLDCKGVGSHKCDNRFRSYNDLMDHRRDDHNSGNIVCRYFKIGSCHYMDSDNGGCWYIHKQTKHFENSNTNDNFDCSSCDNVFKSRTDVMKHRLSDHTEEVPMCNSIAEKKKCAKNDRCWFRHLNPINNILTPNVVQKTTDARKNIPTKNANNEGFWEILPVQQPPDMMGKLMEMLTLVMAEVSQIKHQIQT